MSKTVSIVIPVYNVEQYLRACLDSIAEQTYSDLEVILVDDGSTDQSGMICDLYASKDPRFRVIHQSNAGAANAKNTGLDAVSGNYVTFIDSDDWVEPDWIETMLTALESTDADVAECDFKKEFMGYSEPGNDTYITGDYTAEEYLSFYLDNWTCSLFWNKLFRTELTRNVRFRRERRCIDDEFFTYKVLSGASRIVRVRKQLYHYRQRISSAVSSEKNRLQITDDALEVLIERYEWVSERFPELKRIYLRHDVGILFYFADAFVFSDRTIQKFRSITNYYFKESIYTFPGIATIYNVLKLRWKVSRKLNCFEVKKQASKQADFFP